MYGEGISKEGNIIDMGVELGLVKKSGAWFNYGEERLGQGRENAKQFLIDNPDIIEELDKKIRQESGLAKKEPEKVATNSKEKKEEKKQKDKTPTKK